MLEALDSTSLLLGSLLPRGDNTSLVHWVKLAVVLALYVAWLATLLWVDKDSHRFSMPRQVWNLVNLACCGLGLFVFYAVPNFGFALILSLLFYLSPVLVFVSKRNEIAPPPMRVLTPDHLRSLLGKATAKKGGKGSKGGKSEGDLGDAMGSIRFHTKGATSDEEDADKYIGKAQESPGYKAAMQLIMEAISKRATDIHLEPTREEMTIRYRVDSIMQAVPSFNRSRGDSVVNVFKVLSAMDITEKRKAQDGSFSADLDGRKVDFRVATAGSVNGQKMVIRILDASRQVTTLKSLGLRPSLREQVEEICQQSFGMLIACGPTGAGKTSTLYACLGEIDRFQRNVITLENPVEYQMENVTQIEVNPKAGKTFANELRSVLRQDPDVILVGEVRDAETAEIACQAAQTGHMVFTTLHANDSVTSIGRLIDLGVKPFNLSSALSAVLAQRLARTLCPKCKTPYNPADDLLKKLKIRPPSDRKLTFYKATEAKEGTEKDDRCDKCGGTGYMGRTGLFELLVLTDEIKEMVRENPDLVAIRQAAIKTGTFTSLFEDGIKKVVEGKTSLEEITRVAK